MKTEPGVATVIEAMAKADPKESVGGRWEVCVSQERALRSARSAGVLR